MIKLSNVTKKFDDTIALDQISMEVAKSSIYGLLGSNGAGKTTVLKLLAGIYTAEKGFVQINEKSVFEQVEVKQSCFFIPDTPYFITQYTIKQMASYYKSLYHNWSDERYRSLSKIFQIDEKTKISRLSKGTQRQVAFWLAFSTMPQVLLLDEPMDGLDPVIRVQVRRLIIEDVAERNMTVVISSHNIKEIENLCDAVVVLHKGKVLFEKELDELTTDIHKFQLVFKEEVPQKLLDDLQPQHLEKRGSVLSCIVRGDEEELLAIINPYKPILVDVIPLTLEEVFILEMEGAGYAVGE